MSKFRFFHGLINSLFDKPINTKTFSIFSDNKKPLSTQDFIDNVSSARGEVSALGYAELLIQHCEQLNEKDLIYFFKLVRDNFDIDSQKLSKAVHEYKVDSNSESLIRLMKLSEPKRREIFRRCNGISRGTIRLVNLRKRLLDILKNNPELKAVDYDLVYLFKNWFNRGFLILRPINWETPAHILEKIIAYEAVHEINSWDELRLRLAPKDRRCFAFFHPAMLAASPSLDYKFLIICSPGGAYYSKSLSVYVEDKFSRATPGGAGYAKAAGNYGASFYPISLAVSKGFDQIVWTDSLTHQKIEEVGTMSIMFRIKDKLITPKTSDTILDGVSRKTVIQIARDLGIDVEERDITINELISEHQNGNLKEIFGCGTAVVISKISSFGYKEHKFELEEIKENYADRLKQSIINIQQNISEDLHGWRYKILD